MVGNPLSGQSVADLELWLSPARLNTYATAAGNLARGLDLYEWNTAMASALMRDIGFLEVGMRSAYDRCLLRASSPDWANDPGYTLFVASSQSGRTGNVSKLDEEERMFSLSSKLTTKPLTDSIWTPYLHHAFPKGTKRSQVHGAISNINNLRNRVAHHEALFTSRVHLPARLGKIEFFVGCLSNPAGPWVLATSTCRAELIRCPVQI